MTWSRRHFLALLHAPSLLAATRCRHLTAVVDGASQVGPPTGKRVPFGWQAIAAEQGVSLRFRGAGAGAGTHLRLCMAIDSREQKKLAVRSIASGKTVGEFDLRFAYALQMFEIPLEGEAARGGLELHPTGGSEPAWILSAGAPAMLLPHLLQPGTVKPIEEFHRRLQGPESLQPFGWMEGCVLDGLSALGYRRSLEQHLARFAPDTKRLVYENPRSEPADDRITSIEESLPIAHLVLRKPGHPAIETAVRYWMSRRDEEGCVINGGMTSAEGSYTVAYPMAQVARVRRDRELEDLAVRQLRLRRSRLVTPDGLFLRNTAGKARTYRNWSRGIAWYMLGLVRTLHVLNDRQDLADLRDEMRRVTAWILGYQGSDGLWPCYVDDPATGPETSGSAGIAAAVALACRLGIVEAKAAEAAAERTRLGLEAYLTRDGFLTGVAQSNRGGEQLQRSGYRVMSQMGMGLLGQLTGALQQRR